MTPWQSHVARWQDCKRCSLCTQRRHVVLARGKIPADVLFIGEAPGTSEDALAEPFVGPAGKLLDDIVKEALDGTELRICFTNLVGCFPREAKETSNHQPPPEAIKSCVPRLVELTAIAKPRLIVTVGTLSDTWTPKLLAGARTRMVSVVHPSAILRAVTAQKTMMIRRAVVVLQAAFRGIK